ncbi:MAG TPA: 3-mercaptopyruvate sulfurtransferase [Sphingomicrobium sp.]|nr:3-mercaptopyruvate sulfurtransferase [Sphingomicrobium sp.]
MDDLVTTQWLADHLGEPDVVAVDCSLFMPSSGRDGRAEFLASHVPGARFLDIEEVAEHDQNGPPHMLPRPEAFAAAMAEIGIGSDDRIVVYDNSPLRSAARGWFMLRHFGASRVAILDGGLAKWKAEGRPVESGEPPPRQAHFTAAEKPGGVVSLAQVLAGVGALVDARGQARFEGSEDDPRPGVASGHIPGARNLPFATLYNEDGTFKSEAEIRRLFEAAGVDPEKPFVASCGSGVTANSLIFAAHRLGNRDTRLYDGSWSEYGADPATPKQKGPA